MKKTIIKYLATLMVFPLIVNLMAYCEIMFWESTFYYPKAKYVFAGILILMILLDYSKVKRIGLLFLLGILVTIILDYYNGNLLLVLSLICVTFKSTIEHEDQKVLPLDEHLIG